MRIFNSLSVMGLVALAVALVTVACGGGEAVRPTAVASAITPIAPTPMVSSFYTQSGDRLVLDRSEEGSLAEESAVADGESSGGRVGPTEVARPTPFLYFDPVAGGGEGGDPPVAPEGVESWEVEFTEEEIVRALALRSPSCTDHFRALIVNYDGHESFGPEVAQRLSDQMVAQRPECLDEGWSPGFAHVQVCRRVRVTGEGGSGVPNTFRVKHLGKEVLGPSLKDGYFGYVLLHFYKLPLSEEPGCWFYRPDVRKWFWNKRVPLYEAGGTSADDYVDGESGVDPVNFHQCDSLLGILIPKMMAAGEELDTLMVAVAIDRVRLLVPEQCSGVDPFGRYFWRIYPQAFPQVGCALEAPTGPVADGRFVINWAEGYLDADGAPCWVLDTSGSGEDGVLQQEGEASAEDVSAPVTEVPVTGAPPTEVPAGGVPPTEEAVGGVAATEVPVVEAPVGGDGGDES